MYPKINVLGSLFDACLSSKWCLRRATTQTTAAGDDRSRWKCVERANVEEQIEVGHSFQILYTSQAWIITSSLSHRSPRIIPREYKKRGLNSLFPVSSTARNCIRFRSIVISCRHLFFLASTAPPVLFSSKDWSNLIIFQRNNEGKRHKFVERLILIAWNGEG